MKNIEILGAANNQFMLGATGMTQLVNVHLHKGTKVFAYGAGMSKQVFVIYDDNMNAVEIGTPDDVCEYDLDKYFSSLRKIESTVRPHSKKFGIGFYYDESGEIISDEVINQSLARAKRLAELKEEVKQRKAAEAAEQRKQLTTEYNYLKRAEREYDHKTAGENIRTELKKNFPNVRFAVRYKSFSGGDEYTITWTDGPTTDKVDKIVRKYQHSHPDYTGDYWDDVLSIFNELFGSVGYVMTNRNISDEAIQKTKERFSDLTAENMHHYNYGIEDANSFAYRCRTLDEIWHWLANHIDWQPEAKEIEPVTGDFKIIDYSDKAIAVTGDTKAIKDDLKRLGGRFNPRLNCGAGWIFSKTKEAELRQLLSL